MVSVTAARAPYLASATTLIKALKSPHDPPQPDWPNKIEIASRAWQQKDDIGHGIGGRVGDIVREWLLESWIRTKGTKGAKNTLLNYSYHDLLRTILQDTPSSSGTIISTTQSHQFLTAFLVALRISLEHGTEELLSSASRTFNVLFGYSNASSSSNGAPKPIDDSMSGVLVRAESWLETLGGLLALCSYITDMQDSASKNGQSTTPALHLDTEHSQGLLSLTQLVVLETNASLAISQTRRKPQTQSSQASSTESMQDPSETIIRELVFPPQGQKPLDLQTLLATLSFLPALSQEYVTALQTNRYSIFPPPSTSGSGRSKTGSNIPPDVYVGDKVREAVRGYVRIISQCLSEVSQNLHSLTEGKKDNTSVSAEHVILEIWKTRCSLWTVVKQWGGYFEGDEAWRQLVTEAVGVASNWLSTTGFREIFSQVNQVPEKTVQPGKGKSTPKADAGFREATFALVEKLFSILLELDYGACKVDIEDQGMRVLAASLLVRHYALTSDTLPAIQVALHYHTLTQSIPEFATLLASVVQCCFSSAVSDTMPYRDIYVHLASGPLVTAEFSKQLEKAASGAFVGGISEERGWGKAVTCLGEALRRNLQQIQVAKTETSSKAQSEVPSKRRRKNDGTSAPVSSAIVELSAPAGTFAILSRLMAIVLQAAYAKGHGYEKNGRADDVLALVDKIGDLWHGETNDAFGDEATAGLIRLRRADQLLRREFFDVVHTAAQGQPETRFEQTNLQLQIPALTGKPSNQPLSELLLRLAEQLHSNAWTGKIVDLKSGCFTTALWHIVAQRGLSIIEEIATEGELSNFAALLLSMSAASFQSLTPSLHSDELLLSEAIQRITKSAEFWELTRMRSAILSAIKTLLEDEAATSDTAVFAFLLGAPSDFLSKNVRGLAIRRAYAIDASSSAPGSLNVLKASERELIRRFMVKIVKDTDYVGPLAEADVLMRLISETIPTSDDLERITQELISIAINALLRDSRTLKSKNVLKLLVAKVHNKFLEALPLIERARLSSALQQLFNTAALRPDLLADDITTQLTPLSSSVLSTFTSQLGQNDPILFSDGQMETINRITTISAVIAYRSKLSLSFDKEKCQDLASRLCVTAMKSFGTSNQNATYQGEQLACSLLKWILVQSNPSQNVIDMKAFFSKWLAFVALLGKFWLTSRARATVILVHQDVSDMLAVCHATILPARQTAAAHQDSHIPTSRDTAHPHLVAILSTVNTLVRHRRDLVINVLPHVMKLYARIFVLFGTPRGRGSVGASVERSKRLIKKDWPAWLSDGSALSLGAEDARLFARALATLSSRTTIRSTSTSSANQASGTMIGQLSKHAPVLLIAYIRAVAHPLYTIPASSRHELVPGIAAMCEAVVAGGKSMLGGLGSGGNENRSAESIGEAFGLGEGAGGEGELVLWGDMWRAWRRSRYVGQG
ncbi:hypothetical protein QFC19_001152 [Naganishia cerealis]|uniref:Uncharacterized protein n=1 Tax=Naganishia cerealis TaxID=610337 RepID=A0ACC2WHZ0_9TREE|nr:hypothetical protein QFC19_001152 [Naganishia cerealis]